MEKTKKNKHSVLVLGIKMLIVISCCLAEEGKNKKRIIIIIRDDYGIGALNSSTFPPHFLFGAGCASYQYEGAAFEDGKGLSIWDTFTHKYPEKIKDGSNGDVAVDFYHRYKEDVKLMKEMGVNSHRFSLSWPRILPNGKLSKGINKKGIDFYHKFIDELLANGIQPFVTLFHWDLPQALEDEYGGFLNISIVDDFKDYADVCFREFGGKVKHWVTMNEPWSYSVYGYGLGAFAPGRCSEWMLKNCTGGDSATEPYLVSHHELLAHAAAVHLYRQKYQASQKGVIGITLVSHWFLPYSQARHDRNAATRALDFMFGWFMDPIAKGDYPHSMRSIVKERLPKFSKEQSKMVKGSFDFVGLNYYAGQYAIYSSGLRSSRPSYTTDSFVIQTGVKNGVPLGPKAASTWFYIYPKGLRDWLHHIKKNYNNPMIYITENGYNELNNEKLSLEEALNDKMRVKYHHDHLAFVNLAIKEGVNVKGYFAWSFTDDLEWSSGYTLRFGIYYVDFKNGLKRYPKLSTHWFTNFLKN